MRKTRKNGYYAASNVAICDSSTTSDPKIDMISVIADSVEFTIKSLFSFPVIIFHLRCLKPSLAAKS